MKQMSTHDHVIRLYSRRGKHILSILRCMDDTKPLSDNTEYDIATPDGKVLFCGVIPSTVLHLKKYIENI